MATNLAATSSTLLSVKLTLDGGTKPGTIGHYKIERARNVLPLAYLVIYETELALLYDHPRGWGPDGSGLSWRYRAYAYITASSSYDTVSSAYIITIATPTNAQIDYSGVTEPTTSAGTFSNTYIAQTESKPVGDWSELQETWAVTEILPLAASSA
jgi:hypothetical protein